MERHKNVSQTPRKDRPIDKATDKSFSWWKGKYTFIKKKEIKTWQAVALVAFAAGTAATMIWTSQYGWHLSSKAATPATLGLSTTKTSAATSGETIPVAVKLNTGGGDVVVVKSIIRYNKSLVNVAVSDVDLTGSVFNSGNTCVFPSDYTDTALRGKPCQIIKNDATNGILSITLAMPSHSATTNPGTQINTADGLVATVNFHAIAAVPDSLKAMGIQFVSSGNYFDSDVIADDGAGTDTLSSVTQRSTVMYGDLNGDGKINGADLSILRANYGNTDATNVANIKMSGAVNGSDLSVIRTNYGKTY